MISLALFTRWSPDSACSESQRTCDQEEAYMLISAWTPALWPWGSHPVSLSLSSFALMARDWGGRAQRPQSGPLLLLCFHSDLLFKERL